MKHHLAAGCVVVLLGSVAVVGGASGAPNLIKADGPGGTATYTLLGRSYGLETPDCGHKVPHITEAMDGELGRPVFVFHSHAALDDDRCGKKDRQRVELRGRATGVQGPQGATVYYSWMFKLPAGFRTTGNFTHIFQIKAYGNGHGSGSPVMTLTPRNNTMSIDGRIGRRGSTDLGKFLNTWVVVDLEVVHSNGGRLAMTIKRHGDGATLLSYSGSADMWDDGAGYGAPKFGIYRSLASRSQLRDEQVRFADFCVSRTSARECDVVGAQALSEEVERTLDDPEIAAGEWVFQEEEVIDETPLAEEDPTLKESDLIFVDDEAAGCSAIPGVRGGESAGGACALLLALGAAGGWRRRRRRG
jgi:hypothetical protein